MANAGCLKNSVFACCVARMDGKGKGEGGRWGAGGGGAARGGPFGGGTGRREAEGWVRGGEGVSSPAVSRGFQDAGVQAKGDHSQLSMV